MIATQHLDALDVLDKALLNLWPQIRRHVQPGGGTARGGKHANCEASLGCPITKFYHLSGVLFHSPKNQSLLVLKNQALWSATLESKMEKWPRIGSALSAPRDFVLSCHHPKRGFRSKTNESLQKKKQSPTQAYFLRSLGRPPQNRAV